jgi:glycosyltransferase involved in cell wall biosynthesis
MSWIFSTAITNDELRDIPYVAARGLKNPPQIAYIGRLASEKGLPNLIEAVKLMKERDHRPIPRVTLIGSGPDGPALQKEVASQGLQDVIRFAGQLNREALSDVLQECDFCVQPSLTEGFSKAWLDAFAHGLPVLASDVGAAGSVIGGNGVRGWLVPPGEVQALEECLRRIMTEPVDWPVIRHRCRAFTEQRTLEVWANEIGSICARQWNIGFEGGKLRA